MRQSSDFYCTVVFLAGVVGPTQALADIGTIVVPPGHEDTEGRRIAANASPPSTGWRNQELYLASEFSSLPDGRGVLVGLAWRPDQSVRQSRTVFLPDTEIRLSTTQAEPGHSLSFSFDRNVGPDETLVYSGDLRMETAASGPTRGPRDFDYAIDFQQPFVYDPSQGNLLLEWRYGPGGWGVASLDAVTSPNPGQRRMVYAMSPSASSAADSWLEGLVPVQFNLLPVSPLQAGDADQDLDFDQFDLVHVQQTAKYLTGEPATWGEGDWNGAPGGFPQIPPPGDGLFNQLDIVAAQQTATYMTGAYAALQSTGPQAAQAPPEPTPPASGVAALLIAESETGTDGGWTGPATLWLDGVEWTGAVTGVEHSDAVMDEFSWHGKLLESYDFDELGTFALSLEGRTTFDVVESDYRWHAYKAAGRLVEGTGAFAGAQGLFVVDGYTRWLANQEPPVGMAWESAPGRIYGLTAIPEPSTVALLSIGAFFLLARTRPYRVGAAGWRR